MSFKTKRIIIIIFGLIFITAFIYRFVIMLLPSSLRVYPTTSMMEAKAQALNSCGVKEDCLAVNIASGCGVKYVLINKEKEPDFIEIKNSSIILKGQGDCPAVKLFPVTDNVVCRANKCEGEVFKTDGFGVYKQ